MNTYRLRNILALPFFLASSMAFCQSAEFTGKVISVSAGDILKIEHDGKQELIVLYGIESPRSTDAYGLKAKEFLQDTVLGKEVQVTVIESKHGLTYTEVHSGDGPSVNELLLKAGLVKWDKIFAPDRSDYGDFQSEAEADGVGMWHRATAPKVPDPSPAAIHERVEEVISASRETRLEAELLLRTGPKLEQSVPPQSVVGETSKEAELPAAIPEQIAAKVTGLSFYHIRENMNAMTEAQFKQYRRSLEGSQIRWQGWVEDVNKKLFGGYEIWIDMDAPSEVLSVQDIMFDIPESQALALNKNQVVRFEGEISHLTNVFGALSVGLKNARVSAQSPVRAIREMVKPSSPLTTLRRNADTSVVAPQQAPRRAAGATLSQSVDSQIREFSFREYPNDSQMQRFVYNQQISAYRYMRTVNDADVKQIASHEYPNDYAMQKFVYDQQSSAKHYMTTVTDRDVKQIALREYPNDYTMQKFVYDQQSSAKHYMNSQPNSTAKSRAQREYPYDYTMQKFTYDRALTGG